MQSTIILIARDDTVYSLSQAVLYMGPLYRYFTFIPFPTSSIFNIKVYCAKVGQRQLMRNVELSLKSIAV